MTSEERNQIRDLAKRPLGSIWGYWLFVFPVVLVVIGIGVQMALLRYFESRSGSLDILIRQGTNVELLWDGQLVKEAVLTVTLSITLTFALLAFLARRSYKQSALLKAAASELSIENGQQVAAPEKAAESIGPQITPTNKRSISGQSQCFAAFLRARFNDMQNSCKLGPTHP
jgi:hypothetical protein